MPHTAHKSPRVAPTRTLLVGLCVASLTLAACGEETHQTPAPSRPPGSAEFARQFSALACAAPPSPRQVVGQIPKVLATARARLAGLERLPPPPQLRDRYRSYLDAEHEIIQRDDAIRRAGAAGDRQRVRALARQASARLSGAPYFRGELAGQLAINRPPGCGAPAKPADDAAGSAHFGARLYCAATYPPPGRQPVLTRERAAIARLKAPDPVAGLFSALQVALAHASSAQSSASTARSSGDTGAERLDQAAYTLALQRKWELLGQIEAIVPGPTPSGRSCTA